MHKLKSFKGEDKEQNMLFFICVVAYTATYLSRDTFSAAMPNILSQTDIVKTDLGIVSTLFLIFYGGGQLLSGILGDKLSPQLLVKIGLLVSGAVNFIFGFAEEVYQMAILWSINGIALSLLWAPLVKVLITYMDDAHKSKALVNMSISMPIGTLTAFFATAFFVEIANFRVAFWASGAVIFGVGILWTLSTKIILPKLTYNDVTQTKKAETNAKIKFTKLFFMSGLGMIAFAVMCNGVIRNGVSIWVPTYLTENFGLAEFVSILTSTIIPVLSLGGIYLAAYINKKTKSETATSAIMFIVAGASLVILVFIGNISPVIAITFLGLATFSMQGLNAIVMSLIPVEFAKYNKSATITGFLNSCAYLASSIGSFAVGLISTNYGWNATIISWVIVAIMGLGACIIVSNKWKNFKIKVKNEN